MRISKGKKRQNVRRGKTKKWKKSERIRKKRRSYGKKVSLSERYEKQKKEKWVKIWKKSEFRFSKAAAICNIPQFCYNFKRYFDAVKVIIE